MTEGGNAGTYTVRLSTGSAAAVTVAIVSNDPGRVTVQPSSLTFASGAPGPAQTVTVTPIEDGDNLNDALTLTHTPSIRGVVNPAATLPVVVNEATDAATAGTRITPPPVGAPAANYILNTQVVTVTSGAGVPAGVTVATTQALTADLDITLAAPAPADNVPTRASRFSLDAGSIVDITLGAMQSVPAGGLEICLPRGRDATLLLRWQTASRSWVEVPGSAVRGNQVCATVTQFSVFGAARPAGVELLAPAANAEFGEGRHAEITVLVQDTTTDPVQVTWSVEGTGETMPSDFGNADNTAALSDFPTGSITVPQGNDQTVTIRIPIYDDDDAEGVETFTVRITQASGGITTYNDAPVTVRIALSDPSLSFRGSGGDGDGAALTASSRLVVDEGGAGAYTIVLPAAPGSPVRVVIKSNHRDVTTSPSTLTFTPTNYAMPQTVTVNAAKDGDGRNETATLTHTLTDATGKIIEEIGQVSVFVSDPEPDDDDDGDGDAAVGADGIVVLGRSCG